MHLIVYNIVLHLVFAACVIRILTTNLQLIYSFEPVLLTVFVSQLI
jgi:hypothetical protein